MSTVASPPAAAGRADVSKVDRPAFERALRERVTGEVRFDPVSRALYATDASVYQIEPLGVVIPRSREDVIAAVATCREFGCPVTMRGGGTSQAGQAIGEGLQIDLSKYPNRLLEVNPAERWCRVEPGIVLDELNHVLKEHGLRFAPDISTASRATIGGMMANNSAGTRSVVYGMTVHHVLAQTVLLADGAILEFGEKTRGEAEALARQPTREGGLYQTVARLAREHAAEIDARYPKILRRVGGYNLDWFVDSAKPFNLAKLMVGSEGTLGVVLEAKLNLVPLPRAKTLLVAHFETLLESLAATPVILGHGPSAVEVMDDYILDNTRGNAALEPLRKQFIQGSPGAILCIEFSGDDAAELAAKLDTLEADLRQRGFGYAFHQETDPAVQQRIWGLREAALGLSMAVKADAKAISFVEDTAVAPEKLRDFIERFLAIVKRHGTTAGVYAHASVGCLHVRPVVNLKTVEGVAQFEAIANEVSDLVLAYGGALSAEHGDGLVRGPFIEKMFGPRLYEAFREIKQAFDPQGLLNPGKMIDAPPLTANLRYGAGYRTPDPATHFDFSDYGGMGGAVDMCSGVGACRKTLAGTMCPSFMATREEAHTTRGRANVLRLAMNGRLGEAALGDEGVKGVLDLCLECRACKTECPTGVDMARLKSEFLAGYWTRHAPPLRVKLLGDARRLAEWGSRLAPLSGWIANSAPARWLNEKVAGIDRRRHVPEWRRRTLARWARSRRPRGSPVRGRVVLFADTFTDHNHPEIGIAAVELLEALGYGVEVHAEGCCARPKISQGLLAEAAAIVGRTVDGLAARVTPGTPVVLLEPSCLSAFRDDVPALLRGEAQQRARRLGDACLLFEEFLEREIAAGRLEPRWRPGPSRILLHGHCHQKSMGLLAPAKKLLERIPGARVVDLDAGCCGMAGSFGYATDRFEVSRKIAERRLLPAARALKDGEVLVAAGVSCRHQLADLAGVRALHPAELLRDQVDETAKR